MSTKYEIYIDESGSFEKSDDNQGKDIARLIGGIIVPEELKKRESALSDELKELGKRFFPNMTSVTHIHVSEPALGFAQQQKLREVLLRFLRDKMPEARIFFIYNLGKLAEESMPNGPQFYRNMLFNILQSIVHYHPAFAADDSFAVRLAHRRVDYRKAITDDLLSMGYLKLKDAKGKVEVSAITRADIDTTMNILKNSLGFTCTRKDNYELKPYAAWDNPFMVMADMLCNTTLHILEREYDPKRLDAEVNQTFYRKVIFYCSNDYNFPFNLITQFNRGMTDKFIAEYQQMSAGRSISDKWSDKYLINPALSRLAEKGLQQIDNPSVNANILGLANLYLMNRDFHKLGDVYSLITLVKEKLDTISDMHPNPVWDPIAYRYHDVCLRYYNHNGNTVEALKHRDRGNTIYERLSSVKDVTEQRAFHEFLNRYSVCDTNAFAFEKAIAGLKYPKGKEEEIAKVFPKGRNEILGKIYGSLMQNYSFMGNYEDAEEYLILAKKHLGQTNFMQVSFEAHLAIDMKNENRFKKCICILFKIDRFKNYFDLLYPFMLDTDQPAFNFHLLLKGLITFPPHKSDNENTKGKLIAFSKYLIDELENPQKEKDEAIPFNKTALGLKEHPWELVFSLLARLLAQWDEIPLARKFWQRASNFAKNQEQHSDLMMGHAARCRQALFELERKNTEGARKLLFPVLNTFQNLKGTNRVIGTFNPNNVADEDGKIRPGWFDAIGEKFLVNLSPEAVDKEIDALSREFLSRFTFNYW